MNILIVSYYYAPLTNPRAFRWTALAEYMARLGHKVFVIAGWSPGLSRDEHINGVTIQRIGGSFSERLRQLVRGKISTNGKGENASPLRDRWPRRISRAIYANTWRRLYWPDHAAFWVVPARRAGRRLLRQNRIDTLITVSHPFSSHWAGLALKRAFPGTRWICDIGDPFAFFTEIPLNNHALYSARNFRAERRVLSEANAAAVTVESCRQEYARHFPSLVSKLTVIPPLLSTDLAATTDTNPAAGPIRLVYSGTLYPGLRDPTYLLQIFTALIDRGLDGELHLFGQINGCEAAINDLSDRCRRRLMLHGLVPRNQLVEQLKRASVLINIGNRTHHQLPSKLVEYIAAGRPILNLYAGKNDASLEALADHPGTLSVAISDQPPGDEVVRQVFEFAVHPPVVDPAVTAAMTARYQLDAIGRAYVSLCRPKG